MDITRRQFGRLTVVGAGAGAGALALTGLLPSGRAAAATPPADAWGDQGDDTYVNPITPADLSDWECIRERAQRQGARGLRRFGGGRCPRDPVALDQQARPAVGLPATGDGYHNLTCVSSGKALDVAGPRWRTAGRSCR